MTEVNQEEGQKSSPKINDDYDDDGSDDEDYPDWVRSIRSKTGLETGVEIEFPEIRHHPSQKLSLSTCLEPKDIAPMFDGTQWAGTRVWRASIVAIQYILKEFCDDDNNTQKKTMLELGCGLGVPGMILHGVLGWNVVLTDKDPLPKQLENNAKANFENAYGNTIQAHELDWSREGVQHLIQQRYFASSEENSDSCSSHEGFDLVLNCDCVYEPLYGLSWKLLVETMDELLRINPNTIMITCLERRKADGVDNFLQALHQSTHVSRVERVTSFESDFPEVQLFRAYGLATT